jgi:hypothetical protein
VLSQEKEALNRALVSLSLLRTLLYLRASVAHPACCRTMLDSESQPFAYDMQDDCENVSCERESLDIPGDEPKSPQSDDGEPMEYFLLDGRPGGSISLWSRARMYLRPWKSRSTTREVGFSMGRRIWLERRRLTRIVMYIFGAYLLILFVCPSALNRPG